MIADILIAKSRRWKSLILSPSDDFSRLILSVSKDAAPNLRHVSLRISHRQSNLLGLLQDKEKLVRALHLDSMKISGTVTCDRILSLAFRWSQMTGLNIQDVSSVTDVDAWQLFGRCPRLVHCTITIKKRTILEPAISDVPITLSDLESLSLGIGISNLLEHIFPVLRLPKLTELRFNEHKTSSPLSCMIQPYAATLQYLYLHVFPASMASLIQSLKMCSRLSLLKLELSDSRWMGTEPSSIESESEALLAALTPVYLENAAGDRPKGLTAFNPNLESIHFAVWKGLKISDKAIFDFLKTRSQLAKRTLRSVKINQPGYYQEMDVVAALEREDVDLRGIDIDLRYRVEPDVSSDGSE